MSLQDESFPADEFLDKFTFSPLPSSKGFQFLTPKYDNQGNQLFQNWEKKPDLPSPSSSGEKLANRQTDPQPEKELIDPHSTSSSSATSSSTTTAATSNDSKSPTSLAQSLPEESHSGKRGQLSGQDSRSKTCISDPDTCDNSPKKLQFQSVRSQTKAGSYQDIHSEYTKRRFRHVASKVAEYIANMKAEEVKRRRRQSQFQRHRSLPETLAASAELTTANEKQLAKLSFSTDELQCHGTRADELFGSNSDGDEGDIESAANTSAATTNNNDNNNDDDNDNDKDNSKPNSNSSSNPSTSGNNDNTNSNSTGDASNETNQEASIETKQAASNATNTGDTIDKGLFNRLLDENERIQSYNEHLQMKLDEKTGENMRLKRNVDYLRIELTNCQDKLKEKDRKISYLSPMIMINCQSGRTSKATQTDFLETASTPPPLPPLGQPANSTATTTNLFITPDTPDSGKSSNNNNNNGSSNNSNFNRTIIFDDFLNSAGNTKSVATIQPLSLNYSQNMGTIKGESSEGIALRQRTNSNNFRMKYKINNNCISNNNSSNHNNDVNTRNPPKVHKNSKKLKNPKSKNKNNKKSSESSKCGSGDSVIDKCQSIFCSSPKFQKNYPMRKQISDTTSDSSSGFLQPIDTLDNQTNNQNTKNAYDENDDDIDEAGGDGGYGRKTTIKKHNRLRRQWLRLLGKCARCTDPHTLDNSASTTQTYTQIPLLEKSLENNCQNVR